LIFEISDVSHRLIVHTRCTYAKVGYFMYEALKYYIGLMPYSLLESSVMCYWKLFYWKKFLQFYLSSFSVCLIINFELNLILINGLFCLFKQFMVRKSYFDDSDVSHKLFVRTCANLDTPIYCVSPPSLPPIDPWPPTCISKLILLYFGIMLGCLFSRNWSRLSPTHVSWKSSIIFKVPEKFAQNWQKNIYMRVQCLESDTVVQYCKTYCIA